MTAHDEHAWRSPRFWILWLAFAGLLGLFWREAHAALSPGWHRAAELGLTVAFFALTAAWLHCESVSLMHSTVNELRASGGCYRLVVTGEYLAVDLPQRQTSGAAPAAGPDYGGLFARPVMVDTGSGHAVH